MSNPDSNHVQNIGDATLNSAAEESFPVEGLLLALQAPKAVDVPKDVIGDSVTIQFQLPSELTQSLQMCNFRRLTSELVSQTPPPDNFVDVA